MNVQTVHAAGPPAPSIFDNPVATGLVILMLVLLLIIAILANLLLGVAHIKTEKEKQKAAAAKTIAGAVILLVLFGNPASAQGTDAATAAVTTIAGLSAVAFYLMASVIFLELLVILVLLINTRILLKPETEKLAEAVPATVAVKKKFNTWWIRLNSFKPVEQEAAIDLGHDYDGIRELDNRLPPWWLYGFYITIIVAGIYLWRFHVSHTGPSGIQEYETAIANADMEVKEYLKKKGDAVDENTVVFLSSAGDLEEGKTIFAKSCIACHKEGGGGDVGPNLTDEYWLHGGDIKSIFKTIRYGINAMPQWQNSYSNKQIAELASYVKSLKGTKPANPKAPQGVLFKEEANTVKDTANSTAKEVSANK